MHVGGFVGYSSVKCICILNRPPSQMVFFLPGMVTSQSSVSCVPSGFVRGFATNPCGWSFRQHFLSSTSLPLAMPDMRKETVSYVADF